MTPIDWQRVLQDEVDAATALLSIARIDVAVNDSDDVHQAWVDAREIIVGDKYLAAIGRVVSTFGVFHEVGHIYLNAKYGTFANPHELESACDRVGGWLSCRRGLAIGRDETLTVAYGATVLDAYKTAPLHSRVAVILGLSSTPIHPAGGDRASIVIEGWVDAMRNQPCPL